MSPDGLGHTQINHILIQVYVFLIFRKTWKLLGKQGQGGMVILKWILNRMG